MVRHVMARRRRGLVKLPRFWLARLTLLLGTFSALLGILSGLERMGWNLSPLHLRELAPHHGPLFVVGFFVTLMGLERAVAVGARYLYAGPLAAVLSMLALLFGAPSLFASGLIVLAFLGLTATYGTLFRWMPSTHNALLLAGSSSWLVGGILFLTGSPMARVTYWWLSGFVLIILGERLRLARILLTRRHVRGQQGILSAPVLMRLWFFSALALLFGSILVSEQWPDPASRTFGLAFVLLALWLLSFDSTRQGLHQPGISRFSALSIFQGYLWLLVGGLLFLLFGHHRAGYVYDAQIHALVLGFVFSLTFAHGSLIFRAITGLQSTFRARAYLAPLLLDISLLLRILGDLAADPTLRAFGGLGNAFALAAFAFATITSFRYRQPAA